MRSTLTIRGALVAPQLANNARGDALRASFAARGIDVLEVSERDFASAAETESPQGVLAIAEIPARSWDAVPGGSVRRVLALDAVQDPGNVGTIVRTAAALGATATVALPGTVDLWNAKVVRSAMGSLFTHTAFASTWEEFDRWRSTHALTMWAADAQGTPLSDAATAAPPHLALVVGNEGGGLSEETQRRADRRIALPTGDIDSLNVAVAAGILLYELRPRDDATPAAAGRA